MQSRIFLSTFFAIALAALTPIAFSQGPVGDEVQVTFDRAVQVGSHTLPAGDYTVRQVTSASNPRVLEFTSNHGTKLDATVTAIPMLQNTPPTQTKVILDNEGSSPRLTRIWVQGKSYGYEFPGESSSAKQGTSAINLEGRFTSAAVSAQNAEPEAPAPVATVSPVQSKNTVVAQQRPVETPAADAPQPREQPSVSQAPAAPPAQEAVTAQAQPTPDIPATALGWVQIALFGLATTGTGVFLLWRVNRAY